MFNFVQVWTVGWKICQRMPGLSDGGFCAGTAMECGAVHDQYRLGWELWDEIIFQSQIEDIGIHIGVSQPNT